MKKLIFLFIISALLYSGCGSPQRNASQLENRSILSKTDTMAVLSAILTYQDTLYNPERYEEIVTDLTSYENLDTLWIINNEHFHYHPDTTVEIKGKTLVFIEPPIGYPKNHHVESRIDLSFTGFTFSEDTLDCTLYSLYGNSFWTFRLTELEGNWKITDYNPVRF